MTEKATSDFLPVPIWWTTSISWWKSLFSQIRRGYLVAEKCFHVLVPLAVLHSQISYEINVWTKNEVNCKNIRGKIKAKAKGCSPIFQKKSLLFTDFILVEVGLDRNTKNMKSEDRECENNNKECWKRSKLFTLLSLIMRWDLCGTDMCYTVHHRSFLLHLGAGSF